MNHINQNTVAADLTVIDVGVLNMLPGGQAMLQKVLKMFLVSSEKHILSMETGVESGDVDQVLRAAHTLKSSAAMVGANQLADLCKDIENITREGTMANVACLTEKVRESHQTVEAELRSFYLQDQAADSA